MCLKRRFTSSPVRDLICPRIFRSSVEVIGRVPVLDDVESLVDLPLSLLRSKVIAEKDRLFSLSAAPLNVRNIPFLRPVARMAAGTSYGTARCSRLE